MNKNHLFLKANNQLTVGAINPSVCLKKNIGSCSINKTILVLHLRKAFLLTAFIYNA